MSELALEDAVRQAMHRLFEDDSKTVPPSLAELGVESAADVDTDTVPLQPALEPNRTWRPLPTRRWVGALLTAVLIAGLAIGAAQLNTGPSGSRPNSGPTGQRPASPARVLVPKGSTSVLIQSKSSSALPGVMPVRTRVILRSGYQTLVRQLNRGTQRPTARSCDGGGLAHNYTLHFRFANASPVVIAVNPDCTPSITDESRHLWSTALRTVLPILQKLSGLAH